MLTTKQFIEDYRAAGLSLFADDVKHLSANQQFQTLAFVARSYMASDWARSKVEIDQNHRKQVYYFSIEFLPGRLMASNLLNLGIKSVVEQGLSQLGVDASAVYAAEADPGLGNGGLGRLGSAFLDAMASVAMPGNGNGIRYQYGLFRQRFIDGYQVELPDDWLRELNVWETRKENRAVIVRFGGTVNLEKRGGRLQPVYSGTDDVMAVPYDTAIPGYENGVVNTMRLWAAEPLFGSEHAYTLADKARINAITQILYPDDSNYQGQELRLRQEYFLVSAGMQSIIRHFLRYHHSLRHLPEMVAIHINDTHPAMSVLELMRILLDEGNLSWDKAWEITVQTLSYTNHTLLSEALETWPVDMFAYNLPRLWQIAVEIDRRFRLQMTPKFGPALVERAAPLGDGRIRMAYLAVIGSHAVNGVAKIHSDLLKTSVLKDFYEMYPKRFLNETNGITQRRWVQVANPELTALIDELIGKRWHKHPSAISELAKFQDDEAVLTRLKAIKMANKKRLAELIQSTLGLTVSPQALFDVQIKRLHAYKRQLLHVFGILEAYLAIKGGEKRPKRVHVFAAKAAPSYQYAKSVIKLINAVADLVNNDPDMDDRLKVAFIPNYGVTLAETIIPAANISEQISLAGKEASGTSNMKLMADGALTLATLDGANIEIKDAVGTNNIMLFGLTEPEVVAHQQAGDYVAREYYERDATLNRILDMLVDGSIPGIESEGREIFDSLLTYNDEYFVLADFADYVRASRAFDDLAAKPLEWAKKALLNIAASGRFSADYTVARYGRDIWHIQPALPPTE